MKAIKILQHIEKNGLNNSNFVTFKPNDNETAVSFVKGFFGGEFLSGILDPEKNYIAFWEGSQLQGVPDAVVTDNEGIKMYIYEVE